MTALWGPDIERWASGLHVGALRVADAHLYALCQRYAAALRLNILHENVPLAEPDKQRLAGSIVVRKIKGGYYVGPNDPKAAAELEALEYGDPINGVAPVAIVRKSMDDVARGRPA